MLTLFHYVSQTHNFLAKIYYSNKGNVETSEEKRPLKVSIFCIVISIFKAWLFLFTRYFHLLSVKYQKSTLTSNQSIHHQLHFSGTVIIPYCTFCNISSLSKRKGHLMKNSWWRSHTKHRNFLSFVIIHAFLLSIFSVAIAT